MELIKSYRNNDSIRYSFNELAKKTFHLDFEDWYQNGYWGGQYNPYSILDDGKVVANVSVNRIDFLWNGTRKRFIQLGTVMTDESYRNKGLIRRLMSEIEKDYGRKADGIYLFANDSVLDFYPKFGFRKAMEYQYSKQVHNHKTRTMEQIPMSEKKEWDELGSIIEKSVSYSRFDMVGNTALILFYVTKFMQKNVFYDKNLNVYAIAETDGEDLFLHNVFSESPADLEKVIEAFGKEVRRVKLGFTPQNTAGYDLTEVNEEDTTLFVKGRDFYRFEQHQIMFPTLSHA